MHRLKKKAREESADLVDLVEHAGDGLGGEFDGDLWRPDVFDDELKDAGIPGTKRAKVSFRRDRENSRKE
jgi:hypothetical protein